MIDNINEVLKIIQKNFFLKKPDFDTTTALKKVK